MSTTNIKHHPLGPSCLFRREACPGSLRMEQGQPEQTNEYAEEGTDYHAIVADAIRNSGDIIADDEQMEAARFALTLAEEVSERYPGAERLIEATIQTPGAFGTLDFGLVIPFDRGLVTDWKFGHGKVDPAETNIQLHAYAVGLADSYDLGSVEVIVAQPVLRWSSSYVLDSAALQRARTRIATIAARCGDEAAPLVAGDHCTYCKAKHVCPKLKEQATALATTPATPDQLTPESLAKVLDMAGPLEKYIGAVKEHAFQMLLRGETIPGWHLEDGRSKREWVEGADKSLAEVATQLGKKPGEIWEMSLLSPAGIEKAWGKSKKITDAISPLITKKPGNKRLARC